MLEKLRSFSGQSLNTAPRGPESPVVSTPREALGEGVDLIVMAPRKGEQFGGELLKPASVPRKANRSAREQVGLCNDPSALVGIGLVDGDVNRLLAQALDEAVVPRKRPNKGRQLPAEVVEGRASPEGNSRQAAGVRTLSRATTSIRLAAVRRCACGFKPCVAPRSTRGRSPVR